MNNKPRVYAELSKEKVDYELMRLWSSIISLMVLWPSQIFIQKYMIHSVLSCFSRNLKLLLCIVPSSTEAQTIRHTQKIQCNKLQPQSGVQKNLSIWNSLSSLLPESPRLFKRVKMFIFTHLNFLFCKGFRLLLYSWLKWHGSEQLYFTYFILFIY